MIDLLAWGCLKPCTLPGYAAEGFLSQQQQRMYMLDAMIL
jgi:hypothetical protein